MFGNIGKNNLFIVNFNNSFFFWCCYIQGWMYLCIYFYATAGFSKHFDILSGRRVTTPCHSFWQRTPKNFRALCVKPNFHFSQWDCLWAFYTKQHWIIIFKSYHCIIFTVVIPSFHPKRQVIRAKQTDKLLFTNLLILRNGLLEIFK